MSFENRYSALDRLLHRFAFASGPAQVAIADMEDRVFAAELARIKVRKPVFVTALPRAGTTLLLEAIESLPEFVSHTYRDMPFVLCPMFWNRFTSRFRRAGEAQERAHQDGMVVTTESPEAFEEMIWKAFCRGQYKKDRISLWVNDDEEFFEFLRNHMRKIIALSGSYEGPGRRYLSKNNLNIARLGLLAKNFPDAVIVVPFRDPLQHAASLLRQHRNFLKMHREDRFARQYMAGIGHFDFGENLRPVDFNSWLDRAIHRDPEEIGFWLEYWFEAYSHLAKRDEIHLICYEDLCAAPEETLRRLSSVLRLGEEAALLEVASRIGAPKLRPVTTDSVMEGLVEKTQELYQRLRRSAEGVRAPERQPE